MVYKERNVCNVFLVPGNLEVNLHFDHGKNGTVEFPVYSLCYFHMKFAEFAV